jgi:hypothetical protein
MPELKTFRHGARRVTVLRTLPARFFHRQGRRFLEEAALPAGSARLRLKRFTERPLRAAGKEGGALREARRRRSHARPRAAKAEGEGVRRKRSRTQVFRRFSETPRARRLRRAPRVAARRARKKQATADGVFTSEQFGTLPGGAASRPLRQSGVRSGAGGQRVARARVQTTEASQNLFTRNRPAESDSRRGCSHPHARHEAHQASTRASD